MKNKLYYENRIALLKGRTTKENDNIIKKLERKLRKFKDNE